MASMPGGINSKNLPFTEAGSGLAMAGITPQNMYARLDKLRADSGNKAGGSKQLWDNLNRYTTIPNAQSLNPQQAALFNQYIKTGTKPAGLLDDTVSHALDWGLREAGRFQQHKPVNFFTQYLMDPLIEGALGLVPGIGPALAIGYGGIKGGVEGGLPGAIMGGLSGWGAGNFGANIGAAASSTGGWASALTHPGAFGHNLWSQLNPFQITNGGQIGGLTNLPGGVIPHIGGNQAAPGFINSVDRALGGTGSAGPAPGGLGGGSIPGGTAGTGGGGRMGALGDIWNWGSYGGGGGNLWGDLLQGGLSYFGSQQAADRLGGAADRAFANSQFQPYNINTPGGSATFGNGTATADLSLQGKKLLGDYRRVMGNELSAFRKFDPQNYSNSMYQSLASMQAPETTKANNNLLSDVYNRGQWGGTVGASDIYSQDMANNLQDQNLRLQARGAGSAESDRLFNQYMKSAAAYHSLLNSPNDFINQGLAGGQARSGANANASQYPWLAAGADYGSSNAFWSTLAQGTGNYINNINRNSTAGNTVRDNYSRESFHDYGGIGLVGGP